MTRDFYQIKVNGKPYIIVNALSVVKETEKAICLKCHVSWSKKGFERDLWFPKSVLVRFNEHYAVADWFYSKVEREHNYNGYDMCFYHSVTMECELENDRYYVLS